MNLTCVFKISKTCIKKSHKYNHTTLNFHLSSKSNRFYRTILYLPLSVILYLPLSAVQRESMDHVQFNPDVFKVSETAKKAKCSTRTEELAQPISRK